MHCISLIGHETNVLQGRKLALPSTSLNVSSVTASASNRAMQQYVDLAGNASYVQQSESPRVNP